MGVFLTLFAINCGHSDRALVRAGSDDQYHPKNSSTIQSLLGEWRPPISAKDSTFFQSSKLPSTKKLRKTQLKNCRSIKSEKWAMLIWKSRLEDLLFRARGLGWRKSNTGETEDTSLCARERSSQIVGSSRPLSASPTSKLSFIPFSGFYELFLRSNFRESGEYDVKNMVVVLGVHTLRGGDEGGTGHKIFWFF